MNITIDNVVEDVIAEIKKAQDKIPDGFDEHNTKNDWIAFINAYSGRAADKVFRNELEKQIFRVNMIKVAGLAISAIAAHDEGYC